MKADLFWVPGPWRGRFAIAARPRGGDWLSDEAHAWREAGIDILISLLENDEAAQLYLGGERQAAEAQAIAFISFPIPDRGIPPSTDETISLISRITAQLEMGKNVAVHCRQGIGRSGLFAIGTLTNSGIEANEAIRIVSSARGISVPETAEQSRWVHQFATRTPVAREV